MYLKVVENLHNFKLVYYNLNDKCPKNVAKQVKKDAQREQKEKSDYIEESLSRTKRTIIDYGSNNMWTYFFTATFDSNKYNSSNINEVKQLCSKFARHLRYLGGKYIFIPEKHPNSYDGVVRYHIHGLLICDNLDLIPTDHISRSGEQVYNLKDWTYGFTTLTKINDINGALSYLTKYVTKDLLVNFNKKRYWCSKDLNKGNVIFSGKVSGGIDLETYRNLVLSPDLVYRDNYSLIAIVDKDSLPF